MFLIMVHELCHTHAPSWRVGVANKPRAVSLGHRRTTTAAATPLLEQNRPPAHGTKKEMGACHAQLGCAKKRSRARRGSKFQSRPHSCSVALVHDLAHTTYMSARRSVTEVCLLTKKSGNVFRVGIFLDFVRLTTRTPHGACVRRARRNRFDRYWGEIERLTTRTPPSSGFQRACGRGGWRTGNFQATTRPPLCHTWASPTADGGQREAVRAAQLCACV